MNPHCECELSGYCERHQLRKQTRQFDLCKGVANTPDCGFKYWRSWELGGMGATSVANPILTQDWECNESESATYTNAPQTLYLGDHVEQALTLVGITQERVKAVLGSCGGCGKRKAKLNQLDQAAREILGGAVESGRATIAKLLGG